MLGPSLSVLLMEFLIYLTVSITESDTSELSEEIWLSPDETVDLSCRAERLGAIFEELTTRWEKDKNHVGASAHVELLPDAGLRLTDLRLTDSGIYICKGKVGDMVVDINTIRLHVGMKVEEELMDTGGPWLSQKNSMGIPNVWVAAFIGSFIACGAFAVIMVAMRLYYRSSLEKYST